jgi:hypothetical protein
MTELEAATLDRMKREEAARRPLADTLAEYAADHAAPGSTADIAIRRAYMAGALAVLTTKAPREELLAECVQFGRVVGAPAERAKG